MVITFPLLTVVDDSGTVVSGATVTVTSVKDKAGADVASPGATVNQSGPNVSVDYDPEAKGEAWVTLAVSKVGSTFTGLNAAPAFYLARDSGRVIGALPAAGKVAATVATGDGADSAAALAALTPFGNLLLPATVSAAVSATSFTLSFGVAVTAANLVGLQVCFTSGPDLPQKGTVVTATQTDSTHVAVTVAASTFTSTPGVGDTAEVG